MIIGSISQKTQIKLLSTHSDFEKVFSYIDRCDFDSIPLGRITLDEMGKLFAFHSKYETKQIEDAIWEAHKKYLDIHYIVEGAEWFGVCDVTDLEITKEYEESNDALLGLSRSTNGILLSKGDYAIVFPEEAHVPGINNPCSISVHKIVFKVPILM